MPRASLVSFAARHAGAFAVALAIASGATAAGAQAVDGVVRYVIDGDTLLLQPDAGSRKLVKLRLRGIDAPEICQRGGVEARDAIARRVAHRRVQVSGEIEDIYHRRLVTVTLDGEDIGAWMVLNGHAWNARYRGMRGPYAQEEREARAARRGVFGAPDALAPRSFRRLHGSCYAAPAP